MLIYVIIYVGLLLFAVSDICPRVGKQDKIFILCFLVLVLTLFRGLRWQTGTDWDQFYYCFQNANWGNITSYDRYDDGSEYMESGYMLLNCIIKLFGDYTLFLLLTNLFLVGSWAVISLKLIPDKPIMTFAFVLVSNIFFPVRLQLAAGIFIWALYALCKQKVLLALLITVVTYFIHKSAIMLLPFVFFLSKEWGLKSMLVVFGISMLGELLSFFLSSLIDEASSVVSMVDPDLGNSLLVYSDCGLAGASEKSPLSVLSSIVFSFLLLCLFYYARKLLYVSVLKGRNKVFDIRKYNVFYNSFVVFTFFYKFFSSPSLANFSRVSEYFTLGIPVCIVMTYSLLEKKFSNGILFSFFSLYYFYRFWGMLNGPFVDVYKSVIGV